MPPVAFGTLAMIPVLDDESICTSPHIFLDSANSSIATFPSRTSKTPHPFLPYAHRESQLLQSVDPLHVTICEQHQRGNSTPHLFLNYSDNSGCKESVLTSGISDSKAAPLRDFEVQCDLFLQSKLAIPRDRAATAARAFRLAAGCVVSQSEPCGSDVFASYLHEAFGQQEGSSDGDMQNTEHSHDDESVNWMKGEIEQQSREIQFLRNALKFLVLSSPQESTLKKVSVHKRSDRHVHLPDVPEEEDPYLPVVGVPRSISIPVHPEDDTSYLDKGMGQHECEAPQGGVEYVETNRIVQCSSETVKIAMEVLHKAKVSARQLNDSFTSMEKGQIHGNRARGITCSVYFQSWGLSVRGRYNGTVHDGIPHGRGVLRFDNRDYYVGEFSRGELHGEGSLFLRRDGRWMSFRGEFVNNRFMGPKRYPQTFDEISEI